MLNRLAPGSVLLLQRRQLGSGKVGKQSVLKQSVIKAWPLPAYATNLQNLIRENGKDREETILVCDKCPCHHLASKSSFVLTSRV